MREKKSKLKLKRVTVDSMLIKRKDVIKHNTITSKKNARTMQLLSNFIYSLSFLFHSAHCIRLILEVNSIALILVLKLADSPCYKRKFIQKT